LIVPKHNSLRGFFWQYIWHAIISLFPTKLFWDVTSSKGSMHLTHVLHSMHCQG